MRLFQRLQQNATLKSQGHDFYQINIIKVIYHILTTKATILHRKNN